MRRAIDTSLAETIGHEAANELFGYVFEPLYRGRDGLPLDPESSANIKAATVAKIDEILAEAIPKLKGGTTQMKQDFAAAFRKSAVDHFMKRLTEEWAKRVVH